MSKLNITIGHKLSLLEAEKRLKLFCTSAPKRFAGEVDELKFTWRENVNNFSFRIGNVKINGTLALKNDSIVIVSSIPFAFLIFKTQIVNVIKQYAKEILES
ncbi:polyhydroxyalkanoic acid system family protein [Flavobacterium sp. LC2016-01]|uniref:polyhydroxyalkanoic acid system family protein n=1 Tax=Flavobacterium sp. LC2016-01 TaxID=2675876 RepID=UPI0012BB09A3|nr:polyhydroxyalkanoic acid system family protein [Flavobacterium sp. LC2016-01]MTH15869.1 hypothetical protein [Flavobacterium sp. LC2016-01]